MRIHIHFAPSDYYYGNIVSTTKLMRFQRSVSVNDFGTKNIEKKFV